MQILVLNKTLPLTFFNADPNMLPPPLINYVFYWSAAGSILANLDATEVVPCDDWRRTLRSLRKEASNNLNMYPKINIRESAMVGSTKALWRSNHQFSKNINYMIYLNLWSIVHFYAQETSFYQTNSFSASSNYIEFEPHPVIENKFQHDYSVSWIVVRTEIFLNEYS